MSTFLAPFIGMASILGCLPEARQLSQELVTEARGRGRVETTRTLGAALPRARWNRGYCGDGTAAGTHTHCQACVTPSPRSTYFPCGYTTSRWTIVCRYPAGGWAPTAGAGTGC